MPAEARNEPSDKAQTVLLGVTGSIAAFRGVELASALTGEGLRVVTLMSDWACRFIQPLSFSAVTMQPVLTDADASDPAAGRDHIAVAREADLLAIVPATANTLGKLAHGIADNLITLAALAYRGPILIAPAMNCRMYESEPVQQNVEILRKRGCHMVGPVEGRLACGEVGKGRMAAVEDIMQSMLKLLEKRHQ